MIWYATAPPLAARSCVGSAYRSHREGAATGRNGGRQKYYNREQPYPHGAGRPAPRTVQVRHPHISPTSACTTPIASALAFRVEWIPMSSETKIVSAGDASRLAKSPARRTVARSRPSGDTQKTRARNSLPGRSYRISYYTMFFKSSSADRDRMGLRNIGGPSLPRSLFPWILKIFPVRATRKPS